ncbi:MAG: glycosyltransferase [Lachnospiraceae bacterium]
MIFSVAVMKEMLENLMQQPQLSGDSFWKRILSAVSDDNLPGSGFSEFETYGNYVMKYHPGMYALRILRGLRKGAGFSGDSTEKQLLWAAKSYDTIAFKALEPSSENIREDLQKYSYTKMFFTSHGSGNERVDFKNQKHRKITEDLHGEQLGVSIIVPIYNVGEYLKKCVESLEQQNFEHTRYCWWMTAA